MLVDSDYTSDDTGLVRNAGDRLCDQCEWLDESELAMASSQDSECRRSGDAPTVST